MTIHKLKVLEFPVVFCIGFVDGVMQPVETLRKNEGLPSLGFPER